MQDLANTLEAALKYRVDTGAFGVTVFTGHDDDIKVTPSMVIHATSGAEMPLGTGNCTVAVTCELRMTAETDDLAGFRQLGRDAFGLLMADDLASVLSSEATDLHVFGISNRSFTSATEETHWTLSLGFDCYCCRTDC